MEIETSDAWFRAGADDLTVNEAMELALSSQTARSMLAQNGGTPRPVLEWIYKHHPRFALDVCMNLNAPPEMKLSIPFRMHSRVAILQCLEDLGCSEAEHDRVWEAGEREPELPLRTILDNVNIAAPTGGAAATG